MILKKITTKKAIGRGRNGNINVETILVSALSPTKNNPSSNPVQIDALSSRKGIQPPIQLILSAQDAMELAKALIKCCNEQLETPGNVDTREFAMVNGNNVIITTDFFRFDSKEHVWFEISQETWRETMAILNNSNGGIIRAIQHMRYANNYINLREAKWFIDKVRGIR